MTSLWNQFFLNAPSIKRLPEWLRAWLTITASACVLAILFCLITVCILLVRLGIDALFAPFPNYQEAARNFLLAFASAFGAPFLVWRAWVAHRQAVASAEQARIALENHITGIFSKSIELMGSVREAEAPRPDGTIAIRFMPNIEGRLGAIYSLERILRESEKDRVAILETLCAYVREISPFETPEDEAERSVFNQGEAPPRPTMRKDVQAAITVIGRRPDGVATALDLQHSNLIAYDFSSLNFDTANFSDSFLNGANMRRGSFKFCVFKDAFMRSAKLQDARFDGSTFDDCDLRNAEIDETHFACTKFIDTDLRRARVTRFHIEGANLENAFGYSLEYSVKSIMNKGVDHINAQEITSVFELFQKATHDKKTSVSQPVRDAIEIMAAAERSKGSQSKPNQRE